MSVMEERQAVDAEPMELVRLNLSGHVAARLARRLVEAFGSVGRALRAGAAALAGVRGIRPEAAEAIAATTDADAAEEVQRAERIGAHIVTLGSRGYPERLASIPDPPLVLYVRGSLEAEADEPAVAVVGSRHPSRYGVVQAERLGRGLSDAAVTVVSGLARGIDTAAHRGALAGGGRRTVAVLGSGLGRLYPPENAPLADEIVAAGGAIVSEFATGTPPLPFHFPRRNRTISGLSLGVVVVEAAKRSGSLLTADWALELGRTVFAVPGRVGDESARGTLRLLREGAALVESAEDVTFELGLSAPRVSPVASAGVPGAGAGAGRGLDAHESRILDLVGSEPRTADELIDEAGLPAGTVLAALTMLELRDLVRRIPGQLFVRAGS